MPNITKVLADSKKQSPITNTPVCISAVIIHKAFSDGAEMPSKRSTKVFYTADLLLVARVTTWHFPVGL